MGREKKLKWLKTRLTGHAQKAFQNLPEEVKGDFDEARDALSQYFEPKSRQARY